MIFQSIFGKSKTTQLREELRAVSSNEEFLRERLADLEMALEDVTYQRLNAETDREFSREGLRRIMALSRLMFLKNPLINRAVTLQSTYVWGQGCTVQSTDETVQAIIDAFWKDDRNECELTGHQARMMKEQDLQVLGNLFFALFTAPDGSTVVRTLPAEEVLEIVCNPDDAKEPWFYRRTWTASALDILTGVSTPVTRTAWYPDFRYEPTERPERIGEAPVMWDSPVYHVRVGGLSDMRFGLPETYQAQDWAKAYNVFLENWSTIVQAYARFAFKLTTKGGKAGIAAAKTRFGTTMGVAGSAESNPPPQTAAMFIGSEGTDMQPVKTAGATTSADDARRLLLMVCAAFGMPESFFGDVSVGNLATAKSLDRPTELKFRDRQMLWADVLTTILKYVVKMSRGVQRIDEVLITVTFPPILEHDIAEQMGAIVAGATLNGSALASTIDRETLSKLVLNALSVPNVQEVLDELKAQWAEEDARKAEMAANLPTPGGKQPPADPVAEAVRNLSEAIEALRAKVAA